MAASWSRWRGVRTLDKITHFEIPADDLGRAKEFYSTTFGWQLNDVEGIDYTMVITAAVDDQQRPTEPGAINGGMMKRGSDTPASPVITITVDSVDDALKKVEAGGGSVVRPREEIPGMGAFAYFTDPEGNTLGLWENA
jgi:predicted enzyme related to lactoylglutathione lyase